MYEYETSRRINKEIAYLLSHARVISVFFSLVQNNSVVIHDIYNMVRRWIMHLRLHRKRYYHATKQG